jgi:ABC-type hemin transport system substrate-binding protein
MALNLLVTWGGRIKTLISAWPGWAGMCLACFAWPVSATTPRVVTLAPHLAELVCEAAGCDKLVAVTAYSDFPAPVKKLPQLGDVHSLNLEALIALRPSHVLLWQGGTPPAQQQQLARLRLPVHAIAIERMTEVPAALEQIGSLLGTPKRARAAAARYRSRLAALQAQQRAQVGARLRVFYQIETAPAYSINRQSPISDLISLCGGLNVFAGLPTLAAPVSVEAVLASRPQVVVHSPQDATAVQAYWARFASPAQAAPTLLPLDSNLLARAGPRMVQGAEQLCTALNALRRP